MLGGREFLAIMEGEREDFPFPPILMEGLMERSPFEFTGAASIGRREWFTLFAVVAGACSLCPSGRAPRGSSVIIPAGVKP